MEKRLPPAQVGSRALGWSPARPGACFPSPLPRSCSLRRRQINNTLKSIRKPECLRPSSRRIRTRSVSGLGAPARCPLRAPVAARGAVRRLRRRRGDPGGPRGAHSPGNVILASERCCSRSRPSASNRNTLKARCSSPAGGQRAGSCAGSPGPRPAPPAPPPRRPHLGLCSRSGGSCVWCRRPRAGRPRPRGCTSPTAAAPAARPAGPAPPPACWPPPWH